MTAWWVTACGTLAWCVVWWPVAVYWATQVAWWIWTATDWWNQIWTWKKTTKYEDLADNVNLVWKWIWYLADKWFEAAWIHNCAAKNIVKIWAQITVDIIINHKLKVYNIKNDAEVINTLDRIESWAWKYGKDWTVFENREWFLSKKPKWYYKEYTVDTPWAKNRWMRRIVTWEQGEQYFSSNHYETKGWFTRIK